MRWLIPAIFLFLLLILQLAFSGLGVFPSVPNLILVYLCVLLAQYSLPRVLALALGAGVFLDFFSGLPDGIIVSSLAVAIIISYYVSQMIFAERQNGLLVAFYPIFATIVFFLAVLFFDYSLNFFSLGRDLNISQLFTFKLGADVIFNLLALYPLYLLSHLEFNLEHKYIKRHDTV